LQYLKEIVGLENGAHTYHFFDALKRGSKRKWRKAVKEFLKATMGRDVDMKTLEDRVVARKELRRRISAVHKIFNYLSKNLYETVKKKEISEDGRLVKLELVGPGGDSLTCRVLVQDDEYELWAQREGPNQREADKKVADVKEIVQIVKRLFRDRLLETPVRKKPSAVERLMELNS
jgi:hypothetical protein